MRHRATRGLSMIAAVLAAAFAAMPARAEANLPAWATPPAGALLSQKFTPATVQGEFAEPGWKTTAVAFDKQPQNSTILIYAEDAQGKHQSFTVWSDEDVTPGSTMRASTPNTDYWLAPSAFPLCGTHNIRCGKENAPIFRCACARLILNEDDQDFLVFWLGPKDGFQVFPLRDPP